MRPLSSLWWTTWWALLSLGMIFLILDILGLIPLWAVVLPALAWITIATYSLITSPSRPHRKD